MNYLAAIVSILIAEGTGLIGSFFTSKSISSWYPAINKPSWNPPNWTFGPVWITLYAYGMGRLYRLETKKHPWGRDSALVLWSTTCFECALVSFLFWP